MTAVDDGAVPISIAAKVAGLVEDQQEIFVREVEDGAKPSTALRKLQAGQPQNGRKTRPHENADAEVSENGHGDGLENLMGAWQAADHEQRVDLINWLSENQPDFLKIRVSPDSHSSGQSLVTVSDFDVDVAEMMKEDMIALVSARGIKIPGWANMKIDEMRAALTGYFAGIRAQYESPKGAVA